MFHRRIKQKSISLYQKKKTAGIVRESDEEVLKRDNKERRAKLRKIEKNRRNRHRPELVDPAVAQRRKFKILDEKLYHLVAAIPLVERDSLGIYLGDLNGDSRKGPGRYDPELGPWSKRKPWLNDYSEPVRLLTKFGRYESDWRQKAASPVRHILITFKLTASYLAMWRLLTPPEVQLTLKQIGRLYKDTCWRPWLGKARTLADRCESSSRKAGSWSEHHHAALAEAKKVTKAAIVDHTADAVADIVAAAPETSNEEIAADLGISVSRVREARAAPWKARAGAVGEVVMNPPRDHAKLMEEQAAYNKDRESLWNLPAFSRQRRRTLNVSCVELQTNLDNLQSALRSDHHVERQNDRVSA